MPLIYKIIPYRGKCTADDQVEVVEKFIEKFGVARIDVITGDREFDNEKLITYLNSKSINYALRIRKTNRIMNKEGEWIKVVNLKKSKILNLETQFYSIPIKLDHIKLESGEYLSVVYSATGLKYIDEDGISNQHLKDARVMGFEWRIAI